MGKTMRAIKMPPLEILEGLVHGFEQRLGPAGWESREDGRRRVGQALAPFGRLYFLQQVHGAAVRHAPWEGTPEGDASVAEEPGRLLAIETADCLPLLLVDPRRRAVAAAHAGWRGTAAGVAGGIVEALLEGGSRAVDILVAMGPSIGPCCYEVGEELTDAFGADAKPFFRRGREGRCYLDLPALNRRQLLEAGILPSQIHDAQECTFCHGDLYHSFRREGANSGRMVNYVGWASSSPR